MELTLINGDNFREMLRGGQRSLEEHRSEVDALNVFPVPDGDTGTNMMLTIRSAVKEVESVKTGSLSAVAKAASTGSMMGARGNSGVILSQLLRGMAQSLEGREEADGVDLANALQTGVKTAYKSVMKPIEGTILTVAREAAQSAAEAARRDNNILKVLDAAIQAGEKALIHTPELLPVLKKAGVVDAGGKGLLFVWMGMREALTGRPEVHEASVFIPEPVQPSPQPGEELPAAGVLYPTEELTYTYCTEAVIRGSEIPLDIIREELAGMGDSLVVAGNEELVKIHVHTNHPGLVLETCLSHGAIHQVKIDNMRLQHQQMLETTAVSETGKVQDEAPVLDEDPQSAAGVVAVAPGEGLAEILRSLGVEVVVEGGQSMNPSIEDLVTAIEQTNAEGVLVLPNNSNVIMAAEQARGLTSKEVKVLPSRSFPQAVAAMISFNPSASLEENYPAMLEAMERVRSGEVTFAVRDSQFDGVEIKTGQILGLAEGRIQVVNGSAEQVAEQLVAHMVKTGDELISLYWGHEETEESAAKLAARLQELYPQAEVEVHYGGQPLYYYIISVE